MDTLTPFQKTTSNPDLTDCLNLNQTPAELTDLYGGKDYYWYLRSPEFKEVFLKPIGKIIQSLPIGGVLDVGCGEGQLSEFIGWGMYYGIDGSASAILRGRNRIGHVPDIRLGRMEYPTLAFSPDRQFGTVVFGGILEVLIKPEKRVEFIKGYLEAFRASYFVVYDLLRLDTSQIDNQWNCFESFEASAEVQGLMEVKKHRKVRVYRCHPIQ